MLHQVLTRAVLAFVIVGFGLLGKGEGQVYEQGLPFVLKWGVFGGQFDHFNSPQGATVDGEGNVYVANTSGARVQKFSSDGTFITTWGGWGAGDGQFNAPNGVAVDGSGNVYVADRNNHRIQKFDRNGTFIAKWGAEGVANGQFKYPRGVAVDEDGHVYVVDTANNRIQKFDSDGGYITKWGSFGDENGQFGFDETARQGGPGIAVDGSGNVYVADRNNHRIQKFDRNGTFITQWGALGSEVGQFRDPNDVAVDGSGNVYVVDRGNQRIQKYDRDGTFITQWGALGDGDGQFRDPCGVAINGSGNLYVVDTGNHRIQLFGANAAPVAVAGPDQTGANAVACTDPDGTLVTLDGLGSSDPDGHLLTYTWRENGVVIAGPTTSPISQVMLAQGTHTIELTVEDGNGGADTNEVDVAVKAEVVVYCPADGTAEDVVGGHNGTLFNGATYRDPGVIGKSFQFDGQDDYFSAPFTHQGPFSVSLWVDAGEVSQATHSGIIASTHGIPHAVGAFQISFDGLNPGSYVFRIETESGNVDIPIGFAKKYFQHITVTYDGTQLITYLDGQAVGSEPIQAARFDVIKLGVNRRGNRHFNGFIDEVRVYTCALSEAEIAELAVLPNPTPVANNSGVSGDEDTQIAGQADAQDAFGDPLTFSLVQGVSNGQLSFNNDGTFTYKPNADFNGSDAFSFTANDGNSTSNEATVSITVNPVNDAPALFIQQPLTVDGNGFGNINNLHLIAKDVDNAREEIVYKITQGPVGGSLIYALGSLDVGGEFTQFDLENGGVQYNNTDPTLREDSFGFVVTDGENMLEEALFTINITPIPPVAKDDSYEIFDNEILTVAAPGVLGNDANPSESVLITRVIDPPEIGTLELNSDGAFTYTPELGNIGDILFTYEVVSKAEKKGDRIKELSRKQIKKGEKKASKDVPSDNIGTVTITVKQSNIPPVARCQDIDLPLDENGQATLDPALVDNGSSDPEGGPLTFSVSPNAFTCENLGSNTVTLTVTDDKGLNVTCDAIVTIKDVTPPTITLAGEVEITLECGIDAYTEQGAAVADMCDPDVTVTIGGSVDISALGDYAITYDATDASGNGATQVTRTVHVVDTTPPEITLAGDAEITLECGIDTYTEQGATATDMCDPDVTVTVGGSVDMSALGDYAITYDATDASGNVATQVTRTVHVVDTTPPEITLAGDAEITLECGIDTYTEQGATATDMCDPDVTVTVGGSVDMSALGDYAITYDATDASGNVATQVTRTVHVVDTTPPEITAITEPIRLECTNPVGESVTVSVEASDFCDPELDIKWFDELGDLLGGTTSVTVTFGLGDHWARVVITDDSGNATEQIVTVKIEDTTPAEIEAALNPVSKPKSDKSKKSSKSEKSSKSTKHYEVVAKATDLCDEEPVVTAFITQPLTGADMYEVKYKSDKKKNEIGIKIQEKKIEVDLRGPNESVLLGLLNDALDRGGFLVADGQLLELKSKELGKSSKSKKSSKSDKSGKNNQSSKDSDPRKGNYTYEFDLNATLQEVDGIAVRLVVSAVDASGNESDPVEVAPPVGRLSKLALTKPVLGEEEDAGGEYTFGLDQNYPNPFNPSTTIRYSLGEASDVHLVIYNVLGQQVRVLVNQFQTAGRHEMVWDGRDALGRGVSSGLYLYRLQAGSNLVVRKMLFAK